MLVLLQISKIYPPTQFYSCTSCLSISKTAPLIAVCYCFCGGGVSGRQHGKCQMRRHLYDCLNGWSISAFPKKSPTQECFPHPTRVVCTIKVYCYCQMPEQYDVKISCDRCNRWYHYRCVYLELDQNPRYWECPSCLQWLLSYYHHCSSLVSQRLSPCSAAPINTGKCLASKTIIVHHL